MGKIIATIGFVAFVVCGSCGLGLSAVAGLVLVLIGSRLEEADEQ